MFSLNREASMPITRSFSTEAECYILEMLYVAHPATISLKIVAMSLSFLYPRPGTVPGTWKNIN